MIAATVWRLLDLRFGIAERRFVTEISDSKKRLSIMARANLSYKSASGDSKPKIRKAYF
jgi:hypothetical protein